MHISSLDIPQFYSRTQWISGDALEFARCVENIPVDQSKAKVILHQSARLLWLGEQVSVVATARPAFQVLFALIVAELVAKIVHGFKGEGQSRKHVHLFFEDICSTRLQEVLGNMFEGDPLQPNFTVPEIVNFLYDIRCDVVHEGHYFGFHMPLADVDPPVMSYAGEKIVTAVAPVSSLQQVVLEGALLGARRITPTGSPCRALIAE